MKKMLRLPVALALALGASNAFALGLGQVQVKSSLNQPLLAEIPILENAPGEAAELQIRLASAESFARIGLERPNGALVAALQFNIVEGSNGRPVIRITTANRINDPFLGLLIEAEWARGKLLREYTLLLDPPVAVPSRATPSQTTALPQGDVRPAPAESLASPPPMPAARPGAGGSTATPSARPAAAPSLAPGESYGPVNEGDSVWRIASRAIPDSSININQMMIALQRANPDAFIGGNINRLRTGAVLRIPSRDEALAIRPGEAAQLLRDQSSDSASLQPVESAGTRPTASAPAAAPADSRLAIVPPRGDTPATAAQSGAAAGGQGAELRADLARAREQSEAAAQENRELRTRVQELEKIRGDSERLLELRNSELQALQQRLAELEAQRAAAESASAAPPAVTAEPTPKPVEAAPATTTTSASSSVAASPSADLGAISPDVGTVPADDADADPAAAVDSGEPAEGDDGFEATPSAEPEPAPVAVAPEPAAAPPVVTPPAPAPVAQDPWYMSPLVLGGGGAVLIGLLAMLGLRGRGKKKAAAAAASAGASSRFEGADFGVPGASQAYEASPESYDDAEERELLDQVAEQPDDLERHLDLVRYYYGLNDASRFEGAVEAMYAQVYDPDEPAWQQALEMGREMLPDHPLFMEHAAQSPAWEPSDDSASATSAYGSSTPARSSFEYVDAPAAEPSRFNDEPEYRIDLATPELEVPELSREAEFARIDSSRLSAATIEAPTFELPPELSTPSSGGSLDLDISADAIEAAATKLELARAYLDMGDVEGARGMLEEVAQEGTTEQRGDARRLLDEIR
jgi:pilus assembly protein FimV